MVSVEVVVLLLAVKIVKDRPLPMVTTRTVEIAKITALDVKVIAREPVKEVAPEVPDCSPKLDTIEKCQKSKKTNPPGSPAWRRTSPSSSRRTASWPANTATLWARM